MTDISDVLRQAQSTFEPQPDPYGRWLRLHERRRRSRGLRAGLVAGAIALGVIVPLALVASHHGRGELAGSTQGPAQNGLIAYADGSSSGLFSIHPDGTGKTQIPTPPGGAWLEAWSPDGTQLAVSIFDGARALWVMNADGSDPVQVASGTNVSEASWSPDGTQLAVAVQDNGGSAIHIVNADGSGDHIVSPVANGVAVNYLDVAWSPDGAKIAWSRGTDSGFDIYVMNADGSGIIQLTHDGHDYNPAWSPDGSQIAFTRQGTGPQSDIYVMDADGSQVRQLTDDGAGTTNQDPQWSPDGTRIAYLAGKNGGPGSIAAMNPDGSDKVVLVHGDLVGFSWQPVFGPLPPAPSSSVSSPSPSPTVSFSQSTLASGVDPLEGPWRLVGRDYGSHTALVLLFDNGGGYPVGYSGGANGEPISQVSVSGGGGPQIVSGVASTAVMRLQLTTSDGRTFDAELIPIPENVMPSTQFFFFAVPHSANDKTTLRGEIVAFDGSGAELGRSALPTPPGV